MTGEPVDPAEITARGHRWVRTSDGRLVEYSVCGSARADARVLISTFLAGAPTVASWTDAYETLNVRAIDVSLPGIGYSSLHPGRRVADWPSTDLEPVLEAEGVGDFTVIGTSVGTIHAMAVALHFGPERVQAMGLRVPYFGLPLSRELGLPDGQLSYPTTEELLRNTFRVRMYRYILQGGRVAVHDGPGGRARPAGGRSPQHRSVGQAGRRVVCGRRRGLPTVARCVARESLQ